MLLLAVLGVAPVLAVEVFERERPVARQPDAPVPDGNQQQHRGGGPAVEAARPKGEHHGRRDAPVGVVNGDVAEHEAEKPYHHRGGGIGDEQRPQVVPAGSIERPVHQQPDHKGERVNHCEYDKTETAGFFDRHSFYRFLMKKLMFSISP